MGQSLTSINLVLNSQLVEELDKIYDSSYWLEFHNLLSEYSAKEEQAWAFLCRLKDRFLYILKLVPELQCPNIKLFLWDDGRNAFERMEAIKRIWFYKTTKDLDSDYYS